MTPIVHNFEPVSTLAASLHAGGVIPDNSLRNINILRLRLCRLPAGMLVALEVDRLVLVSFDPGKVKSWRSRSRAALAVAMS